MKHYIIPNVNIVKIYDADIVTLSVGNGNTASLDFDLDFTEGVTSSKQGNSISLNWSDMS